MRISEASSVQSSLPSALKILHVGEDISSRGFNLPSFTPPVRATVGEVRYSIEIDVGGGKGSILQTRILRKILAENGPHV